MAAARGGGVGGGRGWRRPRVASADVEVGCGTLHGMTLLLGFAIALMLAVFVSALARRSVLSTAVLSLAVGVLVQGVGWVPDSSESFVEHVAELALFSVTSTDGMRVGVRDLVTRVATAGTGAAVRDAVDAGRHCADGALGSSDCRGWRPSCWVRR